MSVPWRAWCARTWQLRTARRAALKLIIGAEFTLTCGLKFVALAMNRQGYARLCALITHGRRAAPKGSYHLTREDVQRHLAGVPDPVAARCEPVVEQLQWLRSCFAGNLWIAVELLLKGTDREYLAQLPAIGREYCGAAGGERRCAHACAGAPPPAGCADRDPSRGDAGEAGARLYPNGERHLRERGRLARLYPPQLLAADAADRAALQLQSRRAAL